MEFDDIERILELVRQHELAEFELERDGLKLRVKKALAPPPAAPPMPVMQAPPAAQGIMPGGAPHHVQPVTQPPAPAPAGSGEAEVELAVVKSPIVGTFYRSSEPGAPAFAEVGQQVKKDQVLCIIEAMKLMNEITSEYDGEIVSVYVENGKPVQYGERLFAIKTNV
jgi:acetyl-CoA carboxylase biotin carboxyl carrier protein